MTMTLNALMLLCVYLFVDFITYLTLSVTGKSPAGCSIRLPPGFHAGDTALSER